MQLAEVIRQRRMVRDYDPQRAVARDQIDALLELAIRAPSAGFSQGWRFLVLDEADSVERFWRATADTAQPDRWLQGMMRAPALIVAFTDKQIYLDRYAQPDKGWSDRDEGRWAVPYWYVDTGMASLLVLLGAVDAGLAACLFGVPAEKVAAVRAAFAVPAGLEAVAVISLGYAAPGEQSRPLGRQRRPVSEVTAYNSF